MDSAAISPPLAAVKVVDFSELLPGPFLTQMLAELGAEVIKIERPSGDPGRRLAPGAFSATHRGKTSLFIDLKSSEGRQRARQLVLQADVVVESLRPGVMRRFGLDYDAIKAECPRLVYLSLTGFGQSGPMAAIPGHDLNFLATAGALALAGTPAENPAHAFGLPVGDLSGSMYAITAILAALLQRTVTGRGQYLDVSITDCIAHWGNIRTAHFVENGINNLDEQRRDVLLKPAYGVFVTRDHRFISIAALEDVFWARLVRCLEIAEFASDRFARYSERRVVAATINEALARTVAGLECQQLLCALVEADVPATEVVAPLSFAGGAHATARQLCMATPAGSMIRFPVRIDGLPQEPSRAGSTLQSPGLTVS